MSFPTVLCVLAAAILYQAVSAQQGIGSSCIHDSDCLAVSNSLCLDRVCSCLSGYVPSSTINRCLAVAKHGEECEETIQCNYSNRTECRDRKCACQIGYNFNGLRCVGNLGLGSTCSTDSECVVKYDLEQRTVWCSGGQCSCRSGLIRDDDRCVIGGDCDGVELTCAGLENSFCDNRNRDRAKCVCNNGYIAAVNNTKCLPVVNQLGAGCEDSAQCSRDLGKTACIDKQCGCAEGVSLSEDRTRCGAPVGSVISFLCLALIGVLKYL
eukprot:Gregarina_sp_Poly_1__6797@NODE_3673_length_937_cov_4_914943_g2344_i0_p1_GENE_NODE_3673_length_937_cov_4_914943_g2344_i0NODE_3673_length_937_cov_4_914943_g2344_i0_p1_ORF_typecomplete_len267_score7_39EB/PF01683_18/2_1e07EB/PF01683_18/0_00048EB/PF01683_18/4_2e05EB/PF01683_18/2_2EB/PF01683_18/0_00017RANK_CRD_2/PF18278_1/19RANK_CRD_2/PF18278_1/0_66RANK_CRD_2/PF18278_1/2e03RANK_CRD_2/PF18278_1/15RANK_CRD_2/PF18278_1/30_NODE_3673_length_937_cov_4_914943_g2344_i071871